MQRKWWALISVCLALFMLLLDITIVNVALPDIQEALNADFSDLQWVIDAYALTLAALLLTAGSIADMFGRKRLFMIGLVLFVISSVLCALSATPWQLIGARGIQGIGGAIMFATSLAIVASAFHGKQRGMALGVVGATIGVATAVGPTLGGALTSGAGWEWIFLINVPVGAIALLVAGGRMEESGHNHGGGVDFAGLVTFSVALFALVFALIEGPGWGWGDARIVSLLVASVVLLVAFTVIETRVKHPMFDLGLFANRTFIGAAIVGFTISASVFAMTLYLVIYFQGPLGFDAFETGLRFLPMSLVSFVAAAASGRLSATMPKSILMAIGMLAVAVSMFALAQVEPGDSWMVFFPGFLLAGFGIGLVNPALAGAAVAVVHPRQSGMASGINSTFRQVGIATGIAGLGALFRHSIESNIVDNLRGTPAAAFSRQIGASIASGGDSSGAGGMMRSAAPKAVQKTVGDAITSASASALTDVLYVAAIIAFVGAVASIALVRERDLFDYDPDVAGAASQGTPAIDLDDGVVTAN